MFRVVWKILYDVDLSTERVLDRVGGSLGGLREQGGECVDIEQWWIAVGGPGGIC